MRLTARRKSILKRLLLISAITFFVPLFFSWLLVYVGIANLESSNLIGNEMVFVLTSSYILPLGFYFYFPIPFLIPFIVALILFLFHKDFEKLLKYCAASVFLWLLAPGLVAGLILAVSAIMS